MAGAVSGSAWCPIRKYTCISIVRCHECTRRIRHGTPSSMMGQGLVVGHSVAQPHKGNQQTLPNPSANCFAPVASCIGLKHQADQSPIVGGLQNSRWRLLFKRCLRNTVSSHQHLKIGVLGRGHWKISHRIVSLILLSGVASFFYEVHRSLHGNGPPGTVWNTA